MDEGALCYRRFLDGDESGFDELIRLYHDRLICFLYRYVKNFETAEDLAADTFMELIVHKKRYAMKSSFKTYLFSIAKNKAVDHIRRERRILVLSSEEIAEEVSSDVDALESAVIRSEELRAVRRILPTLHEDYAAVLHLLLFEEMDHDEIAAVMKKSKKQIANLVHRARQALSQKLREEGLLPHEEP